MKREGFISKLLQIFQNADNEAADAADKYAKLGTQENRKIFERADLKRDLVKEALEKAKKREP